MGSFSVRVKHLFGPTTYALKTKDMKLHWKKNMIEIMHKASHKQIILKIWNGNQDQHPTTVDSSSCIA